MMTNGPRTLHDPRSGRLPWVKESGRPDLLNSKAAAYLWQFDYGVHLGMVLDSGSLFPSEEILAGVVCNLRHYFSQNADKTVELVRGLFNPEAQIYWSPDAIRLTWDLVEGYTPTLGLADERAVAKRRKAELQRDVADLIAYTRSGGDASALDLYNLFKEWNPELEVTDTAFGIAVHAVTGQGTKVLRKARRYVGFHLPSPEELSQPDQAAVMNAEQIEAGAENLEGREAA